MSTTQKQTIEVLKEIMNQEAFLLFQNVELDQKYAGFETILQKVITTGNVKYPQTEDITAHFSSFPYFTIEHVYESLISVTFDIMAFVNSKEVQLALEEKAYFLEENIKKEQQLLQTILEAKHSTNLTAKDFF